MRLIEVTLPDGDKVQPILKATLKTEPLDHRLTEPDAQGKRLLRLTFRDGDGQKAIDAVQAIMEGEQNWRLVVIPIEASVPRIDEDPDEATRVKRRLALREEMFQDIAKGAEINSDFLMLTALSTVVVVFGLSADNVAAVIGAMVIAPLLGPILAFSFGSALGDLPLMLKAARTAVAGLALGLALSFLVGLFYEPNLYSNELMSRTVVGPDSAALALAAFEAFHRFEVEVEEELVREAFAAVRSPGRLEPVPRSEQALIVLDGAHNPAGIASLAEALTTEFAFERRVVVLGVLDDKDVEAMVAALVGVADHVVAVPPDNPRAADPERIARACATHALSVEVAADVEEAIDLASGVTRPADGVIVTGSLYLVGEAREALGLDPA